MAKPLDVSLCSLHFFFKQIVKTLIVHRVDEILLLKSQTGRRGDGRRMGWDEMGESSQIFYLHPPIGMVSLAVSPLSIGFTKAKFNQFHYLNSSCTRVSASVENSKFIQSISIQI